MLCFSEILRICCHNLMNTYIYRVKAIQDVLMLYVIFCERGLKGKSQTLLQSSRARPQCYILFTDTLSTKLAAATIV
jgi:hypothetical protein